MAINQVTQNSPAFNVRYSAFLGMLYVSNPETEELIKNAKELAGGDAAVKKGFQGSKGDSPSAKAIHFLHENNVTPVKVSGLLATARVIEREVEGRKTPYLTVGLKDDDGRYYISIDLSQSASQMLARKLANAEIGVFTEIGLFATYGQRPGANRAYANHGATMKQNGVEVVSIDPKSTLAPRIDAAMKALEDAGVSLEDKETYAKRRAKVEVDFHLELMNTVNERVTAFYESIEQPTDTVDD